MKEMLKTSNATEILYYIELLEQALFTQSILKTKFRKCSLKH